MFFTLSKILAILLEPLFHPYLLLLLAGISKLRKKRRAMRFFVISAIIVPLLYGFLPLSSFATRQLENRFPQPTSLPETIDGIIVLGGHTGSGEVSESRNQPQQNGAAERLTFSASLHAQYPDSILLFTGFSSSLVPKGWDEPQIIKALLSQSPTVTARAKANSRSTILFEETSRNTYENAVNSRTVLVPQPASSWILVTSAIHMPRAISTFEAAGWRGIIPYPVDFTTTRDNNHWFDIADGHDMMRRAWHEIFGLIMYRFTNRTAALWPSPNAAN
ncbi:YdcF family protein [Alphaproteobacteria bacterium]|nr:YdcF family protein [Alphaproteobacteria bacterium]